MSALEHQNRTVLITGAAGGLGRELTRSFAAAGWRVFAGYHRELPPAAAGVQAVRLDVTDAASVVAAFQAVAASPGLAAVVNNAGLTADQPLWQLGEAEWDRVQGVNLRGVFLVCRAAAPLLAARGGGHILNLASHSGRAGSRGQAGYAAAKAGVIGLTQSLARELGPQNICANVILPGVMPTPMTAGLTPEQRQAFVRANALNRLNDPAEVARFAVFLTTLANVSGQVFQLDSRVTPWT